MTWCLYFFKIICNHTHIYYIHIIFGYGIYIGINSFRRGWKATNSNMFFFLEGYFWGELCFSVLGIFFDFCFPASLLFCFSLLVCFYSSLLLCFSTFLLLCFFASPPCCLFASPLFCFSLVFCFSSFFASLLSAFPCFSAFPASLLTCFSASLLFPLFFVVSHTADNP